MNQSEFKSLVKDAFAQHTENGEKLVICQALYPPYKICTRPFDMFSSEVDREKYTDENIDLK